MPPGLGAVSVLHTPRCPPRCGPELGAQHQPLLSHGAPLCPLPQTGKKKNNFCNNYGISPIWVVSLLVSSSQDPGQAVV